MKKNIALIVTLSLIGILAVSIIALAFIKTDYNQISLNNIYSIEVFHHDKENTYTKNDNYEVYTKILELYKKGTKEVILSSLIQGAYSKDAKPAVETKTDAFSTITDSSTQTSIAFWYTKPQTLKIDGKVYKGITNNVIEYEYVVITIENTEELTTVTAYINDLTDPNKKTYASHRVTFVAQFHELYDYITNSSDIVLTD